MTSSLVGSEMCIRDRSTRTRLRPSGSSRAPPPRIGRPSRRRSPSCGPVSYTHLTLPTICSV
eukprot:8935620-Prorocentrum_lima.AAC.1